MTEKKVKKSPSALRVILYIVLAFVLLTVVLEVTGLADVAGKRENEQLIDRPHG